MRLDQTLGLKMIAALAASLAIGCGSSLPEPLDETYDGTLEDGDNRVGEDRFYDNHEFRGIQGWQVEITLTSTAFEPEIFVHQPDGSDEPRTSEPSGSTARLAFTARTGEYKVRAQPRQALGRGDYTLRIQTRPTRR